MINEDDDLYMYLCREDEDEIKQINNKTKTANHLHEHNFIIMLHMKEIRIINQLAILSIFLNVSLRYMSHFAPALPKMEFLRLVTWFN